MPKDERTTMRKKMWILEKRMPYFVWAMIDIDRLKIQ